MDSLIGILVWVVIIGIAFNKNRKSKQEQQERQRRRPSSERPQAQSLSSVPEEQLAPSSAAKGESIWAELRKAIEDASAEEKQIEQRRQAARKVRKAAKQEPQQTVGTPTVVPTVEPRTTATSWDVAMPSGSISDVVSTEGECLEPGTHRHGTTVAPTVTVSAPQQPAMANIRGGLTKRDWARAMAMSVILGDPVAKSRRRK